MPTRPLKTIAVLCVSFIVTANSIPDAWSQPSSDGDDLELRTMKNLLTVNITTPDSPPQWALWQRHLMDNLYPAALEFVEKYTRADGTLIWRDEWPGMDGSDDGYESFYNFPL